MKTRAWTNIQRCHFAYKELHGAPDKSKEGINRKAAETKNKYERHSKHTQEFNRNLTNSKQHAHMSTSTARCPKIRHSSRYSGARRSGWRAPPRPERNASPAGANLVLPSSAPITKNRCLLRLGLQQQQQPPHFRHSLFHGPCGEPQRNEPHAGTRRGTKWRPLLPCTLLLRVLRRAVRRARKDQASLRMRLPEPPNFQRPRGRSRGPEKFAERASPTALVGAWRGRPCPVAMSGILDQRCLSLGAQRIGPREQVTANAQSSAATETGLKTSASLGCQRRHHRCQEPETAFAQVTKPCSRDWPASGAEKMMHPHDELPVVAGLVDIRTHPRRDPSGEIPGNSWWEFLSAVEWERMMRPRTRNANQFHVPALYRRGKGWPVSESTPHLRCRSKRRSSNLHGCGSLAAWRVSRAQPARTPVCHAALCTWLRTPASSVR